MSNGGQCHSFRLPATPFPAYICTRSSCALRAHSDRRCPVGHASWISTRKRNRRMRRIRRKIKIHKTKKEGGGDGGSGPPETPKIWPEWWSRNPQISSNGPEKSLVFEVEGSGSVCQFSWCSKQNTAGPPAFHTEHPQSTNAPYRRAPLSTDNLPHPSYEIDSAWGGLPIDRVARR